MKHLIIIFTFITSTSLVAGAQTKSNRLHNDTAIRNIKLVFEDYIKSHESTDSEDDKELMLKSLEEIERLTGKKDLVLLINVWMYYDPTDFPEYNLVYEILEKSVPESIQAVKWRIKNKKKWETDDSAPYSDLPALLKRLEESSKTIPSEVPPEKKGN